VLLGPPGSGKGTQGELLAASLGVPVISTGGLFRDQMSRGTPLGIEAKSYMTQGQLVPDRVTNDMVRDRLSQADAADGCVLDGYPRNVAQVGVLDQILAERTWRIDAAVELRLPEDLIVERLLRRAVLESRPDDTEPVIRERLAVYHRQTEPIAQIYQTRGLLVTIDGDGLVEEITRRISQALRAEA
jgi:adenylate kinase